MPIPQAVRQLMIRRVRTIGIVGIMGQIDIFTCAATGYIAVPLPVLRIKGDEGQHIDGCFKHIQTSVCADIMESVLPFL